VSKEYDSKEARGIVVERVDEVEDGCALDGKGVEFILM
jgi:hypothetical protein